MNDDRKIVAYLIIAACIILGSFSIFGANILLQKSKAIEANSDQIILLENKLNHLIDDVDDVQVSIDKLLVKTHNINLKLAKTQQNGWSKSKH